jgi:hypothetical protein
VLKELFVDNLYSVKGIFMLMNFVHNKVKKVRSKFCANFFLYKRMNNMKRKIML